MPEEARSVLANVEEILRTEITAMERSSEALEEALILIEDELDSRDQDWWDELHEQGEHQ